MLDSVESDDAIVLPLFNAKNGEEQTDVTNVTPMHFPTPSELDASDPAFKPEDFSRISSLQIQTPSVTLKRHLASTPQSNMISGTSTLAQHQPQELSIINYLINEHLQSHGYKMTSISFADENDDQDLEDWEDIVGVSKDVIPPPPNLLVLFRSWKFSGMFAVPQLASLSRPSTAQTKFNNDFASSDFLQDSKIAGASSRIDISRREISCDSQSAAGYSQRMESNHKCNGELSFGDTKPENVQVAVLWLNLI